MCGKLMIKQTAASFLLIDIGLTSFIPSIKVLVYKNYNSFCRCLSEGFDC